MVNFSAAPDFPPASQQWLRDVQNAINAEQDTQAAIQGQLAASAAASSTQVSVSAPDVVNAGILLGDPPTVYVDPYAYFTKNGYTFGGLNISWDYRGANGEILGGQANRYQVAVREVRVESDYPVFADMRVDPPPTGDSQIVAETESTYAVVNRLDVVTTYAIKVRSITATGTPGVWSDEVIVTTPKEPKVRPIDPPLLDQCGSDVCVTWSWTQYFNPGSPGLYPDLVGFNISPVSTSNTGETVTNTVVAPNGKIFTFLDCVSPSDRSKSLKVIHTDGTVVTLDPSPAYAVAGGLASNFNFAVGHDGNLYGVTTHIGNELVSITAPVSSPNPWEVVWQIDATSEILSAVAVRAAYVSPTGLNYADTTPATNKADNTGIIYAANDNFGNFGYRRLNTSTLVFSEASFTSSSPTYVNLGSGGLTYVGFTKFARPIRQSGGVWDLITYDVIAASKLIVSFAGPLAGLTTFPLIFSDGGSLYAITAGGTYSIDWTSGTTALVAASSGQQTDPGAIISGGTIVETLSYARGSKNGVRVINASTGYQYDVWAVSTSPGVYGSVQSSIPINPVTGSGNLIWGNSYFNFAKPYSGTRTYIQSSGGVTFLDSKLISGDPGTPSSPLNTELPWPEIKYVVVQRLTLSGWIDVGTYLGPGTVRDPEPPGTYQYRLVPVSNMGVRGDPTAAQTITVI